MQWDTVAELSSLLEQFRRPSGVRKWELLDAEWRTWFPNLNVVAEGDLWMPCPSDPTKLIRGNVFLFDGSSGRPVVWQEPGKGTAAALQPAAYKFQTLASLGGDIIARLPELVANEVRHSSDEGSLSRWDAAMLLVNELHTIVNRGGSAEGKSYEQWWLAYLFQEVASQVIRCPLADLIGGVAYEVAVKGVFRTSEAACERLIALFAPPVVGASPENPDRKKEAKHSPDFRSVNWFGQPYEFSTIQAACVRLLWEAWRNGTPVLGDAAILEGAESNAERLGLVFRDHPAWGTMIVEGQTKGTHRLADPPQR